MSGPTSITLNAGVGGAALGVDSDGTYDYQIVKLGYSVAGSTPTQVSSSNALPVVQTGALPAGTNAIGAVTQSGSWTVTANMGTTNGLALDSSVNGILLAQGSTTSGQDGPLVQGAVTTASPSYTTGKTSPLSLDASGNLRVNVVAGGASGGTSLTDASTFTRGTTAETPVGGVAETSAPSLTTGKAAALSLNLSGGLRVDASGATVPVSGTFWQASQPVSGTVTANAGTGSFTVAQATAANLLCTASQGGAPWAQNITQFGGTNVSTGTGASGAGIPRVTISNDSSLALHQSTNVDEIGGSALALGQATMSASVPVAIASNQSAISVALVPQTGNGWSKFSTPKNNSNTPLGSTVVAVKSSAAGELGGYIIYNPNSSAAYVQVFDVATAGGVTLGTTRPDMVIPIPATSGANLEFANGVSFANGIQIAAATTDSGSTGPSTGLTVTILYK